jgi:hypothetical protein
VLALDATGKMLQIDSAVELSNNSARASRLPDLIRIFLGIRVLL